MSKVATIVLALAIAVPVSLLGESDVEKTNRELDRMFGRRRATVATATARAPLSHRALLDAMNEERAARGLRPLRLNAALSEAAADRVADMFAKRYFDHVAPDGTDPFIWVDKRGYRYRLIGENLALGYRSAGAVVDGWMRSPGHRANILKSGFDEIGLAVASDSPARGYAGPTIVALYGSR